jgi:hypothetical protein
MLTTTEIVNAIKNGQTVKSCGNKVVAEGIDYDWQTVKLRVELKNGASYPLDGSERCSAEIID